MEPPSVWQARISKVPPHVFYGMDDKRESPPSPSNFLGVQTEMHKAVPVICGLDLPITKPKVVGWLVDVW